MKFWKLALGAGAACAACCAAPLISGIAALGIGSGVFAGGMAAWSAYAESWLPLAAAGAVAAAIAIHVARRRRQPEPVAAACGCPTADDGAPSCGMREAAAPSRT
jgi:hypothetical protein